MFKEMLPNPIDASINDNLDKEILFLSICVTYKMYLIFSIYLMVLTYSAKTHSLIQKNIFHIFSI